MSSVKKRPSSPYVGLTPYTESDAPFFFGRETERDTIIANLRAARLTLFYGASGVGKSSVLRAGVVHNLRQLAHRDAHGYDKPEFVVVAFNDWRKDPVTGLLQSVRDAVLKAVPLYIRKALLTGAIEPVAESRDLAQTLKVWAERFDIELLIILDQFEEYFLYHPQERGEGTFADEFPKAVNRRDLPVRFLISIREDALSKLDRFKGSIPDLFGNRLCIEHLSVEAAREAIDGPIRKYNEIIGDEEKFSVETALRDEVLKQIDARNFNLGGTGRGVSQADTRSYVETPYLQLVMTHIWNEERKNGSRTLRLETLATKLGGAEKILQTHLDAEMNKLSPEEQTIAADLFLHLVTPLGMKIAQANSSLAKLTERAEEEIAPVLEKLKHHETRILRSVNLRVRNDELPGCEIFHDALAPAILDWRTRHEVAERARQVEAHARQVAESKRRRARLLTLVGVLIGSLAVAFVINKAWVEEMRIRTEANVNANGIRTEANANAQGIRAEARDNGFLVAESQILRYERLISVLVGLRSGRANVSNSRETGSGEAVRRLARLVEDGSQTEDEDKFKKILIEIAEEQRLLSSEEARRLSAEAINLTRRATTNEQSQPRIYIQIFRNSQRQRAREIQARLQTGNEFIVPGIETVGSRSPQTTELRYFHDTEAERRFADRIIGLLRGAGVSVTSRYVSGYESSNRIRSNQFELWFSENAFDDGSR